MEVIFFMIITNSGQANVLALFDLQSTNLCKMGGPMFSYLFYEYMIYIYLYFLLLSVSSGVKVPLGWGWGWCGERVGFHRGA